MNDPLKVVFLAVDNCQTVHTTYFVFSFSIDLCEKKSRCFMNTLSKRMSTIMFRSLLAFLPSFNMKLLGKKSKWWKDPLIFSLDKEHLIFYDTETWKTPLFSDLLFLKNGVMLQAVCLTFKIPAHLHCTGRNSSPKSFW